jgi:hypothetical protein
LLHNSALTARAIASRSILWTVAVGFESRKQREERGKGPEPMKAMQEGAVGRNAETALNSRRERWI